MNLDKTERLNRMVGAAREAGRLLLRETGRERLIQGLCDTLVERLGCSEACIGLTGEESQPDLWAFAGDEDRAAAIKEILAVRNPVHTGPDGIPAENTADRRVLVMPLTCGSLRFGVMALSLPEALEPDPGELRMIGELADDVALGLSRIAVKTRQERMGAIGGRDVENFLQIQDKMASLGRVTAGIAHEIRNPLSGIYIYLKAIKQIYNHMGEITRVLSIIDKIEQASDKIESIIQRVMDFSKPTRPRFVMADLNRHIDEVTQLAAVTLRKNHIRLDKHLAKDLPRCWAEPHLIEQVVLNLVTNAAEAMMEQDGEKVITLSTEKVAEGKLVRISVSDTGPGIPRALHSRIFDPFYTTKVNSSGIGLSICNRIILDHGGSLRFNTDEHGGTRFSVELPTGSEAGALSDKAEVDRTAS